MPHSRAASAQRCSRLIWPALLTARSLRRSARPPSVALVLPDAALPPRCCAVLKTMPTLAALASTVPSTTSRVSGVGSDDRSGRRPIAARPATASASAAARLVSGSS